MAVDFPVLDYGPPARARWFRWLLRNFVLVLIIVASGAIGAAIGDRIQPHLYIFNGSLVLPPSGEGADVAVEKQAHLSAIRANIPAAVATLNGQGIPISAAELGNRLTLTEVSETRTISIRCTSRSFDTPLAMVNALIIPYCNKVPGMTVALGTLRRSYRNASAGFFLGSVATGLMIVLRKRERSR